MTGRPILLVEDNETDEIIALRAIKKANLANEVVVARDGGQALDYLFCRGAYAGRDPHILPKMILLDLKLPWLDGFDVLRAIRADERTRYLPVVVLTSSNDEGDILRSYQLGANSYVRKTVDLEVAGEGIRTLFVYWATMNRLPPEGSETR